MENKVNQLIVEFESKLKSNSSNDIELKKLLKSLEPLPKKSKEEFGVKIVKMIYEYGMEAYNKFDLFKLTKLLNYVRLAYFDISDVEEIAATFLELMRGVLELKMQMRENDNLEIYQEDIEDVMEHLPITQRIGLECMLCYANLQANCSMTAHSTSVFPVKLSFVERNVDNMEAISAKFPNDEIINMVYCRSLSATTSELYDHSSREVYGKFVCLLKNLVQTRKFDVPRETINFLKEA